jgi:hypothetical protein
MMLLVMAPLVGAAVPSSYTTAFNNMMNGTPTNAEHKALAREGYNHDVRQDAAMDALTQRIADLEARVDALEADPPPPPPGSATQLLAPADGATLSGVVTVRWQGATGADWGSMYSCGGHAAVEDLAPDMQGQFEVQWDTAADEINCTNGEHALQVWSFDESGPMDEPDQITITLNNTPQPPPPPPAACNAPSAPAAASGYTQVFGDCFDTLDRTVWCDNQWYEPSAPFGSQTVANGELRLRKTAAQGWQNTTMTTEPCGQANPKRFKYGYFEARMKFETVRGNGPAFWLLSTRHQQHGLSCTWTQATADVCPTGGSVWNPNVRNAVCSQLGEPTAQCITSEFDVFEGFGNIQYGGSRTDDFFSGTLHRNSSGFYGVPNSSRFVQRGTGLEMENYHTYAARWTPTEICYFVDDVQQGCVAPFDSTPQPMHLLLYNWNTDWEDENMPDGSSGAELDVFVDWVRVWQS